MGNFKQLRVWQDSKELAVQMYQETKDGQISKDFGLRDQMRRAAISIVSNIAEGDELDTNKQSIRHFHIAKASAAELISQLMICEEIGYFSNETTEALINKTEKISSMLRKLIQHRS